MHYHVNWEIELWADSPQEAAQKALAIQRDPSYLASVFIVTGEDGRTQQIDLIDKDQLPY